MKKMINFALFYAILAMIGGVFYREFTKFVGFSGVTVLGKLHTHLFMLGMFMFLIVAIFVSIDASLLKMKSFKTFMYVYNAGLFITITMMVVRGITQVLMLELAKGPNAAISGIAGIGHILLAIGIVSLLLSLKKISKN